MAKNRFIGLMNPKTKKESGRTPLHKTDEPEIEEEIRQNERTADYRLFFFVFYSFF
ncbi:hypothetical protein [Mesobacillus maritimus]|uniref:hypothetical protein n=1 Tax=Mesobacillus maritimus TaxID=1643336 RepID=UPI00384DB4D5